MRRIRLKDGCGVYVYTTMDEQRYNRVSAALEASNKEMRGDIQ